MPLEEARGGENCWVAVGAGTIHDLVRYTAHKLGLLFISLPTAPSVDGFVSGVAAMTVGGQKITFEAVPPLALLPSRVFL